MELLLKISLAKFLLCWYLGGAASTLFVGSLIGISSCKNSYFSSKLWILSYVTGFTLTWPVSIPVFFGTHEPAFVRGFFVLGFLLAIPVYYLTLDP
jgi:hypothetical protein